MASHSCAQKVLWTQHTRCRPSFSKVVYDVSTLMFEPKALFMMQLLQRLPTCSIVSAYECPRAHTQYHQGGYRSLDLLVQMRKMDGNKAAIIC